MTIREVLKRGIESDKEEVKIHGDLSGDEVPPELASREKVSEIIQKVRKDNKGTRNENKLVYLLLSS